jgi:hypothetical protein
MLGVKATELAIATPTARTDASVLLEDHNTINDHFPVAINWKARPFSPYSLVIYQPESIRVSISSFDRPCGIDLMATWMGSDTSDVPQPVYGCIQKNILQRRSPNPQILCNYVTQRR